jgi:ankyrin repeat protein
MDFRYSHQRNNLLYCVFHQAGMTPLSLAADQGFEEIVRLLLDRGAIIAITSAVSKPYRVHSIL